MPGEPHREERRYTGRSHNEADRLGFPPKTGKRPESGKGNTGLRAATARTGASLLGGEPTGSRGEKWLRAER